MRPETVDDYEAVENAADFVDYLMLLSEEYARVSKARPEAHLTSSSDWAHRDIGFFLEAWAAWLYAMGVEGRPHFPKEKLEPSWQSFAFQLWVARGYE